MSIKEKASSAAMYLFLSIAAFLSLFPFFWMLVSSTNTSTEINSGKFTFGTQLLDNLIKLNESVNLQLILWNTAKIAILSTLLTIFISSLAGYGVARLRSH